MQQVSLMLDPRVAPGHTPSAQLSGRAFADICSLPLQPGSTRPNLHPQGRPCFPHVFTSDISLPSTALYPIINLHTTRCENTSSK